MQTSLRSCVRGGACGMGMWLAASFGASAQNLQNLPGLTDIQRPVATAVQSACGSLSTMTGRTAEQDKLFVSCRKMVQTANALAGSGATAQSLGLTGPQLRDAVQAVGHEEVAVQGRSAVEAAGGGSAVAVRLFSLRNGARGFGLAAAAAEGGLPRGGFAHAPSGREAGGGAADEPSGRLGGFLNLHANRGDKATTANEDGFDFRNHGVTAGLDYRFSDSFVAGVALTHGKTDATIASSLGSADSRTHAVSAYGSWYAGKFYLDGHLSHSRNDYDTVRHIVVASQTAVPGFSTAATGSTRGKQVTAILGAGYDIDRGSWLITPYGRVGYLKLKIDAYSESEPNHGLALDVGSQSLKSLQSAVGIKVALTSSTAAGVVVPFVSLEWNHEFDNDTRSLTAKYTNDPFNNLFAIPTDTPDRNYFSVSGGVSAQFRNGLSAFATLSTVQGLNHVKNRGLAVGVRKEF